MTFFFLFTVYDNFTLLKQEMTGDQSFLEYEEVGMVFACAFLIHSMT